MLLVSRHPLVILAGIIKAYVCLAVASLILFMLQENYNYLLEAHRADKREYEAKTFAWATLLATWLERIFPPNSQGKFKYDFTGSLCLSFVVAVFMQQNHSYEDKVFRWWTRVDRKKKRGFTKETAESESDSDDKVKAFEDLDESERTLARKREKRAEAEAKKAVKKDGKFKKDDLPTAVHKEKDGNPFYAQGVASMECCDRREKNW